VLSVSFAQGFVGVACRHGLLSFFCRHNSADYELRGTGLVWWSKAEGGTRSGCLLLLCMYNWTRRFRRDGLARGPFELAVGVNAQGGMCWRRRTEVKSVPSSGRQPRSHLSSVGPSPDGGDESTRPHFLRPSPGTTSLSVHPPASVQLARTATRRIPNVGTYIPYVQNEHALPAPDWTRFTGGHPVFPAGEHPSLAHVPDCARLRGKSGPVSMGIARQ
jgi:hypothetical protein